MFDGYYVRVAAPDRADAASPSQGFVPIKHRPPDQSAGPAALMVSLDALAFVRFGLRAADDPRIVSTVKIVDATLKVDTPRGPAWHRYQGDAYGEHPDGRPFDGTGVGRAWPLLTGERAHYELAAGRTEAARELARAMETLAGETSLLPEQVWDSADIPARELLMGHPSGSAMPLVWAHAEYIKLCRSLRDGEIFDRPTSDRSAVSRPEDHITSFIWRFNNKVRAMPPGRSLRIETRAAAIVHWSVDGWRTVQDVPTRDTTMACMWPIFRRRACALATASTSRSTGRRRADGKGSISGSALNEANEVDLTMQELEMMARQLVETGKGLLAADELSRR